MVQFNTFTPNFLKISVRTAEFCTFLHINPTFEIYLLLLEYLERAAQASIQKAIRTFRPRLQSCISGEGGHFKQLLHY